jgi:hypothetical protein
VSERPVEEVIGWRKGVLPLESQWCDSAGDYPGARAEVDDLAAWLNSQLSWAGWNLNHDCDDYYVCIEDGWGDPKEYVLASRSTIRDALIVAVRKVADA